jgi:hypothetical protein
MPNSPARNSLVQSSFIREETRGNVIQPQQFIKRHSLISGILLMFLLTWPIDLAKSKVLPIQVPDATGQPTAKEILQAQYARGEITRK